MRKISKKLTHEAVYNYFKNKGYVLLEEYQNSQIPMKCEKDGYRYRISYGNLHYGKNPSLWSFNNIENLEYNISILLEKKQSHSSFLGYEIINKGKKKRILLHFQCQCGEKFDKVLEDAVYKTYICCNQCALKKRGISHRIGDKAIDYIKSQGYKILLVPEICKNTTLVEVEDKDGFRGFVSYNKLKSKKNMSRFDIRINKKYFIYNVNHLAKLQNRNVECLKILEKRHKSQTLLFQCACGNEFETSLNAFCNRKFRCNVCAKSISKYEQTFKDFLDSQNIKYIFQYSLNQCRDILPLPFDFYLQDYNCLVEIDGEGHYHPCNFNQIDNKKSLETFLTTKKHDEVKNSFCKKNHIPLLRISYIDIKNNNYKHILLDFIRE